MWPYRYLMAGGQGVPMWMTLASRKYVMAGGEGYGLPAWRRPVTVGYMMAGGHGINGKPVPHPLLYRLPVLA